MICVSLTDGVSCDTWCLIVVTRLSSRSLSRALQIDNARVSAHVRLAAAASGALVSAPDAQALANKVHNASPTCPITLSAFNYARYVQYSVVTGPFVALHMPIRVHVPTLSSSHTLLCAYLQLQHHSATAHGVSLLCSSCSLHPGYHRLSHRGLANCSCSSMLTIL
jgi:hypothetical protein